jgi:hypothetical protein
MRAGRLSCPGYRRGWRLPDERASFGGRQGRFAGASGGDGPGELPAVAIPLVIRIPDTSLATIKVCGARA